MCLSCLSLIIVKEFNIVYDLEVHVCTYHVNDKVYKQLHFIVKLLRKLSWVLGGLCLETWSQSTVSVIKVELQLIIIIVNLLEGYYFCSAFC